MNQEKIGKFIKESRKKVGLTQEELAEKLGVTNRSVSKWENAKCMPDLSLFKSLCQELHISINELLEGENLKKEDVDKVLNNLVDISNNKIKNNKKKITRISTIVILIITLIFGIILLLSRNENDFRIKVGTDAHFPKKMAIKEKEDGWVCYFEIEYMKESSVPYYYYYNCDNFKYPEMDDYYAIGVEGDENGEYIYKIPINHASYMYNEKYKEDLKRIYEYFTNKCFTTEISINDLNDLKLDNIKKEEVLELYNKAITSNLIKTYGNYPNINKNSYVGTSNLIKDDIKFIVGYILENGFIKYINIDAIKDNKYLSDNIEENKEILDNLNLIKEYILKKQIFELPNEFKNQRPYNFLNEIFDEIKSYER